MSSGFPSEKGLLEDGKAVIEWALRVAEIPPSRIVIYGQSLGTAVGLALIQHYASLPRPVHFAGHVLTATFLDVATLTTTYRIGGVVPILSPLRSIPSVLGFFNSFLINTWMSKDRIHEYVRLREEVDSGSPYHIHLIHAIDDPAIACEHSNVMFWHAVNASSRQKVAYEELEERKQRSRRDLGPGGWVAEHKTKSGLIRQTMLNYGIHDQLMSYPVTSIAILAAFQAADSGFLS